MTNDTALREHLLYVLRGGGAHVRVETAVAELPVALQGKKPAGAPYTPWQQLEHVRITLWDILEYIRNPAHVSPPWPQGSWPAAEVPPTPAAWDESLAAFRADLRALEALVADPATDLFAQIPHGRPGHTILREVLLVADHNAYHLGQLILLRRQLGAWPGPFLRKERGAPP